MAVKTPYSPVGVPETWVGKLRTYGVRVADSFTDLYRRVFGLERQHTLISKVTNSSYVVAFGVPSASSHFVVVASNGSSARFIGYVYANSSGTVTVVSIHSTNNVTTSTATNQFRITLTASATVNLADTVMYGNLMT